MIRGSEVLNAKPMTDEELAARRERIAGSIMIGGWRAEPRLLATIAARDAEIAELRDALAARVVFRGADDDGGESDECALCEARWPIEGGAKHDPDCVLA